MEMEAAPGNQNGVYSERVSDEVDKLLLSSTQTASSQPSGKTFQPFQSLVLIAHVNQNRQ